MKQVPLNRTILVNRLAEIERDVVALTKLRDIPLKEFSEGVSYAVAEHHLRRALEAIFDAGNHILSRLALGPGQRPETYRAIALALGQHKIVPEDFARGSLQEMAGYRNRMTHFYDEITPEELHGILQNQLGDLETFAKFLKGLIEHPEKANLLIQ